MVKIIIISAIYLFLISLTLTHGKYARVSVVERPLLFSSELVQFLLLLGVFGWLAMSIVLLFVNWKLLIGLTALGLVFNKVLAYITDVILYCFEKVVIKLIEKKKKIQ
jgi:hypothetical protein